MMRALALLLLFAPFASAAPPSLTGPVWYELTGTVFTDSAGQCPSGPCANINPCPADNCDYTGFNGQQGVFMSWSGGAYDTTNDRLFVWGGGHSGYGGNEVYSFNLQTETWTRHNDPETGTDLNDAKTDLYPGGTPRARHTYDYLTFDVANGVFITLGGSGPWKQGNSTGGFLSQDVSAFDPSTNTWETNLATLPTDGRPISTSAYDPVDEVHYIQREGPGAFSRYDYATDTVTPFGTFGGVPLDCNSAISPDDRIMLTVCNGYQGIERKHFEYDLTADPPTRTEIYGSLNGDLGCFTSGGKPVVEYSTVNDLFVCWPGSGKDVFTYDPGSPTWTRVTVGGAVTPPSASGNVPSRGDGVNGAYGRFRYSPAEDVFILAANPDLNVFVFKLGTGSGVGVDVTPPVITLVGANPQSVEEGGGCYTELGATANDNVDGDITGDIVIDATAVNCSVPGDYAVTYNVDDAAGNSATQVTRTVSVTENQSGGSNWTTRSSATGVCMATRFDTLAEVDDWKAGSLPEAVSWEQSNIASGNGALRFDILKTHSQSGGNWARWLCDDEREFDTGDTFYVSFRQYVPAFLATHDFLGGGGWKQAIISRHASIMDGVNQSPPYGSNQVNEVVIQNTNHRGLVQGYNRDLDNKYPPWQVGASTACSGSDFIYQNAIDRGAQTGTACEQDRKRYGGLFSYYQSGNQVDGQPDPLTGAFIYYPNEWLTFQIEVSVGTYGSANHGIKLWAAREDAAEWELLINRQDIDLGLGPLHDALWLLPYNTGREPDPSRQDTFTLYDEVIVSTNFIALPSETVGSGDTTAPVITLTGADPQSIEAEQNCYVELGATATDDTDGDISADIAINATAVDCTTPGSYSVTYNVSDANGNAATEVTRTVTITADVTAPSLTLLGPNPVTFPASGAGCYIEFGASASDTLDGDITGDIVIDASSVNCSATTDYTAQVTYNVDDAAGNSATQVIRSVNVDADDPVPDTTPPVITLLGDATVMLDLGAECEAWTDPGVTAFDDVDGDITDNVFATRYPTCSVIGTVPVQYTVSDAAGNSATPVTRTITVQDPASIYDGTATYTFTPDCTSAIPGVQMAFFRVYIDGTAPYDMADADFAASLGYTTAGAQYTYEFTGLDPATQYRANHRCVDALGLVGPFAPDEPDGPDADSLPDNYLITPAE